MTRTFPPGQDFKQMLVISVSIHLMAMITLLFIPKAEYKPEIVIPSFFINLKELPGSPAEKLRSPVQPSPIKISKAEKNVAPRKPRVKKAPTPPVSPPSILKPIAQKSESVKLLEQLETISPSKKPSPLLKELDRIAKTEIKKIAPPKKKAGEKSFHKLEMLKKSLLEKKALIAEQMKAQEPTLLEKKAPVRESKLTKIQESPEVKQAKPMKKTSVAEKPMNPVFQKVEPLNLAKLEKVVEVQKTTSSSTEFEDLVKELDRLEKIKSHVKSPKPGVAKTQLDPERVPRPSAPKEGEQTNAFSDIKKKIETPPIMQTVEIDLTTIQPSIPAKYISQVRNAKPTLADSPEIIPSHQKAKLESDSNILSIYTAEIYKRVYTNWRVPLGVAHKKNIVTKFFLYSKGNIDKPLLTVSSGSDKLDALAVKAVIDSAPFPEFPDELLETLQNPNLHVTLRFNLTPKTKP